MRFIFLGISAAIGLAVFACPRPADAQYNRDYVFTEGSDHLVLRFASRERGSLNPDQTYEIVNAEFSSMVHDRLRADLKVDAESIDPEWADALSPRLEQLLDEIDFEFAATTVECKSASCRLFLERSARPTIPEQQTAMDVVQTSIQAFIDTDPTSFEPVFLIAGYDKEFQIPAIKVYLQRLAPGLDHEDSAHQDLE